MVVQSTDWLARGGAYIVMGLVWLSSAVFFYFYSARYGDQIGNSTDGCLYGICSIVMAFLGGAVGFLLFIHQYPYFVLTSCLGALIAPGLATAYIIARTRPQ